MNIDITSKAILKRIVWYTLLLLSFTLSAQNIVLDDDEKDDSGRKLLLPYALYTESLEFTVGVLGGTSGYLQPQTSFVASVFTTTNDSNALFLSLRDYQLPFAKRIFIEFNGSYAYYTDQRVYTGFNADFPVSMAARTIQVMITSCREKVMTTGMN